MLEILANGPTWKICPKKKKKPILTNVRKRAVGGYYIPVGSVYLKNSEPSVPSIISRMGMEEHTCLHNEPAEKGRKKKKKKNPGINLGQPAGKGREKKQKKPCY
jgi:hypothetical protein